MNSLFSIDKYFKFRKPRPPPKPVPRPSTEHREHYYTGVGATLAVLLDTTIEQLSETIQLNCSLTAQMNMNTIMSLYGRAGYNRGDVNVVKFYQRKAINQHFNEQFLERLSATSSHKQANLRMKLPVGFAYKRSGTKRSEQVGHVVALKCWMEKDDVVYRVVDHDDQSDHTHIRLPEDEQIAVFWCLDPAFYYHISVKK